MLFDSNVLFFRDVSLVDGILSESRLNVVKINEGQITKYFPPPGWSSQIFISFGTLRHETKFMDDKSIIIRPSLIFARE